MKAHSSRCFPGTQENFRENKNIQGTEVETINVRIIKMTRVKEYFGGKTEYESKETSRNLLTMGFHIRRRRERE